MENHVIFELFLAGKGSASGNLQQVNACSPGIAHFCDFHLQRFAMDFGGVGIGNKRLATNGNYYVLPENMRDFF